MHRRNILIIIVIFLMIAFSVNSVMTAQESEATAEAVVETTAEAPTETPVPTEIPTEIPTEAPTEIPTEAPTATEAPTEAPTLEATVEVTSEATAEVTTEPTVEATTEVTVTVEVTESPTPESTLTQIVESENAAVKQAGTWTQYLNESASGSSFIASSGATDDILTLTFVGSGLEIVYVQSAILGTFAIEIDGAVVQTINANSADMLIGTRTAVSGLAEGTHVARIIPLEGIVAIDAFALDATATIITPEATAIPEATETPIPEVSDLGSEQAATTFVVTNTVDSGAGSLRQAIFNANANPGKDTINFNIAGSGVQTIQVSTGLPAITSAVIINGYSQPGSAAATDSTAATLLIEIDGQFAGNSFGLLISGGGSTIKGLVINRFGSDGVFLSGVNAKNNRIEGNHIGVDATGTAGLGNGPSGVALGDGASSNTIGGTTPAARNVISGNNGPGIEIYNKSKNNRVQGNYIGTSGDGAGMIGNTGNGVLIGDTTSTGNIIGGTTAGSRNIIAGNGEDGVELDTTSGNFVQGNYIGTDVTGLIDLGNTNEGVVITNASNNTIGGTTAAASNLISGNGTSGIGIYNGSKRNLIQRNMIGLTSAGNAILPNDAEGITLADPGTTNNTIGGASSNTRNIISGNGVNGIGLYNSTTTNTIQNNYIGTDVTGSADLGNTFDGIAFDGAPNNLVSRNVISGNGFNGISVYSTGGDASRNRIQGNIIGLNAAGTAALANDMNGISIEDTSNMVIGGTTAATRNIISGNAYSGIFICHCAGGITIQGNYIGTDVTGNVAIGNGALGGSGVDIFGSPNNTIGGTTSGARNLISGNGDNSGFTGGIYITGPDSQGNRVLGNYIGTNANGTADLGNVGAGVIIDDNASNNFVGGTASGSRNVISGNGDEVNSIYGPGVLIATLATNNRVQANTIGLNAAGTAALPNSVGVLINEGASNNFVGGTTASARNTLSGNVYAGVSIADEGTSNNLVQGNYIGTNPGGTRALGNGLNGVFIWAGASNNTIGGTVSGARNVISGNINNGIRIDGYVDDPGTETRANTNFIQGNYIGLNAAGTADLGNGQNGISLSEQTFDNLVGSTVATGRNVVSGNEEVGILVNGPDNTIQGNYIGLNAAGSAALGNTGSGLFISDAADNLIGGIIPGTRNVISGGVGFGLIISGIDSTGNFVQGNFIGTNPSGNTRISNQSGGVVITNSAAGNTIGGTVIGARNIISGNLESGVTFSGTNTQGNSILGNYIGTNPAGTGDLGNSVNGVLIADEASGNFIGGSTTGARNVISGNTEAGILIASGQNNTVQGNYVGTNAAGTARLRNDFTGILITGPATLNLIGGATTGAGNVVSGNGATGIDLYGATENTVQGNFVGTNAAGTAGIPNGDYGIAMGYGGNDNLIGGTNPGEGNVVAYNPWVGIGVYSPGTIGNLILGNSVYSNGRLGISLVYAGMTPTLNDAGELDEYQNFPILNAITPTQVTGSLTSAPDLDFRIEFFSSPACDPTGFGEGRTYLGFVEVTTDSNGDAPITFGGTFTTSTIITATATNILTSNTSEFSPCLFLTTAAVIKAPMLVSPANNGFVNDTTPTLSWGAVPNATFYQVDIATDAAFTTVVFTATGPARAVESNVTLSDQKHWWRVRGLNGANLPGPYSAARSFTVDTVAPTTSPVLVSPADNSFTSDLTPAFRWNTMTGAKRYQLVIDVDPNCPNPFYQSSPLTSTSFTLPNTTQLPGEDVYYWCVRGDDAAGNWGPLSLSRRFELTLLRIPLNNTTTTDTTPTFRWNRAPGSLAGYTVVINDTPDLLTIIHESTTQTGTSYTLPNPDALSPGTYFWTIIVTDGNGWDVTDRIFWSFEVE